MAAKPSPETHPTADPHVLQEGGGAAPHAQIDAEGYWVGPHINPTNQVGQFSAEGLEPTERAGNFSIVRTAVMGLAQRLRSWRRQSHVSSEQEFSAPGMSEAAESYWGQEGYIKQAPAFKEQIREAAANPEARKNTITADPTTILPQSHNYKGRSKLNFTEREGLLDLDSFLGQVSEVAHSNRDVKSGSMLEKAAHMRENFSFLGEEEYKQACDGIATMWKEYVGQGEGHVINVYDRVAAGAESYRNSYNVVLQDILNSFSELSRDDSTVTTRIKLAPEEWVDTPAAKLVVVDDWITSGTTIKNNVRYAIGAAERAGLPDLAGKAEAHVLIARQGQTEEQWLTGAGTMPFKVRAYYETQSEELRSVPSGIHSSVDYAFETPLDQMTEYLKENGIDREPPLLTHIEREYRRDEVLNDPQSVKLLSEMASINGLLSELRTEETTWRGRLQNLPFGTDATPIHERLEASTGAISAANRRLNSLVDTYRERNNPNKSTS